jgi:hypothetical protein
MLIADTYSLALLTIRDIVRSTGILDTLSVWMVKVESITKFY